VGPQPPQAPHHVADDHERLVQQQPLLLLTVPLVW
jgi:hypothetical protein